MRKLLLASTAIFLATSGAANARETENPLPKAGEIQTIEIEYDHPKLNNVTFQATLDDWTLIRANLIPAKRDPDPAKWEAAGTVHLTKKDGQQLNVDLYTPSKEPAAFSAGKSPKERVYHRGGNTKRKLLKALARAYEQSQSDA